MQCKYDPGGFQFVWGCAHLFSIRLMEAALSNQSIAFLYLKHSIKILIKFADNFSILIGVC